MDFGWTVVCIVRFMLRIQLIMHLLVLITSRASLIVADTLLVGITWWKLARQAGWVKTLSMRGLSFAELLLRDGAWISHLAVTGTDTKGCTQGTIYFLCVYPSRSHAALTPIAHDTIQVAPHP